MTTSEKEAYLVGVDVGGTSVKLGLFSEDGRLLEKWEIPTRLGENGALMFEDIAGSVMEMCKRRGLTRSQLRGIGLGVPGVVDARGHIERCVNLGVSDCVPADELGRHFPGTPIRCGNDANLAALGEAWRGAGRGVDHVVMITLGTGVGGGIVTNGKLLTGFQGMAGEIGHMAVEPMETRLCTCGGRGCLEQYASATGIVRLMRDALEESDAPSLLRGKDGFSCKDVFAACADGDVLAKAAVTKAVRYLAVAMQHIAQIVDPERILIGGGVSRAGDELMRPLRRRFRDLMKLQSRIPQVRLAQLGNDAGIYGAARLAKESENS